MADNKQQDTQANDPNAPAFAIQRVYLKDMSFESPASPDIFKQNWQPDINLDLKTKAREVEDNVHEVVLTLNVTVKQEKGVAFICEVEQAGIFSIQGFEGDKLAHLLGSVCPNIIYPFARETIADAVQRGGFPQLLLAPVNFEALYAQHLQQQKQQAAQQGEQQEAASS